MSKTRDRRDCGTRGQAGALAELSRFPDIFAVIIAPRW